MDYNARFEEGKVLWEKKEFSQAGKIFEEVAEVTMDETAIKATISAKVIMAMATMGLINQGLPSSYAYLDEVNAALKWINIAENNCNIMSERGERIKKNHRDCATIKGKMLFILQDPDCEQFLQEAVDYGDNQSRFFWHFITRTKQINLSMNAR